jgi:hypothetical protein
MEACAGSNKAEKNPKLEEEKAHAGSKRKVKKNADAGSKQEVKKKKAQPDPAPRGFQLPVWLAASPRGGGREEEEDGGTAGTGYIDVIAEKPLPTAFQLLPSLNPRFIEMQEIFIAKQRAERQHPQAVP